MVKSNHPNAPAAGPEEWGWNGYLYSGYDQQWAGQHDDYNRAHFPDRGTNGDWDYMPWLLNQFHQHDTNTGQRLLDYFTLHCYPEEGTFGNAVDTATALLRNQSTRVFWDTNYVDPSWINSIIMLIPRMKNWVATYYPGIRLGSPNTTGAPKGTLTGQPRRRTFWIFGGKGLDRQLVGPAPPPARRPTTLLRCIATMTATTPLSATPVSARAARTRIRSPPSGPPAPRMAH